MHIPTYTLRARRLNTPPDLVPSLPPTSLREVDRDAWVLGAHLRQSRNQAFLRGVATGFGAALCSVVVGLAVSRLGLPDFTARHGASTGSTALSTRTTSRRPLDAQSALDRPEPLDRPTRAFAPPWVPRSVPLSVPASSVLYRAQPPDETLPSIPAPGWTLVGTPTRDYALIAVPSRSGQTVLPVRVGQHLPDGSVLESIQSGQIITSAGAVSASH